MERKEWIKIGDWNWENLKSKEERFKFLKDIVEKSKEKFGDVEFDFANMNDNTIRIFIWENYKKVRDLIWNDDNAQEIGRRTK